MMTSEKNLLASAGHKAYDLYFPDAGAARRNRPLRREPHRAEPPEEAADLRGPNPNTKFVDNAVPACFANSDSSVNDRLAARKLGWSQQPDLIRTLYNQLIESDFIANT